MDQLISSGEHISPPIEVSGAVELAERLYGIKVSDVKQLNGYDDKNYHLQVKEPPNNEFITSLCPDGYVLKIMNSSDSKKTDLVEAQCKILIHLGNHGIKSPQPQRNVDGKLFCLETLTKEKSKVPNGNIANEYAVRLLSFVKGTVLEDVQWSFPLHYQIGTFTAKIDLVLQGFSHPAYKHYSSLWMLKNCPRLKEFLHVLDDEQRKNLVCHVIKEFEQQVLTVFSSLKAGIIHGDINTHNVLLSRTNNKDEWEVSAVLDVGDAHSGPYVMELALAVAYMILHSGEISSGSEVVRGYCSVHPLPLTELQLLKVCVCARLCQSLVMGLHTHSQDPNNLYVLSSQRTGWRLLRSLWDFDNTQLMALWLNKLPNKLSNGS